MNKGDLVNKVAECVGSKKDAQAAVDCVFSSITVFGTSTGSNKYSAIYFSCKFKI